MARRAIRRIPATEVKTHFGRIVQEVATSDTPVIIQTRGQDQAAIVSLQDLQRISSPKQGLPLQTRERVLAALWEAGLLSEPLPEMCRRAKEYDTRHTPGGQEQILSELRGLHLEPSLSDILRRPLAVEGAPLVFVSADDALVSAAESEGLAVDNPFWHTDLDAHNA